MVHMNRRSFLAAIPLLTLSLNAWGGDGHRLITRLAVRTLPEDMPSFFPAALNEPDEWRDKEERAISETLYPGHETDHIFKADRNQYFDQLHCEGRDARRIGTRP